MRSGDLDKSIIVQSRTLSQNETGEAVETWAKIHTADTIAAAVRPFRGAERFAAQGVIAEQIVTFKIRYRSDVTPLNRIVYDGRNYDIGAVREVGRRDGLEIDATARAE